MNWSTVTGGRELLECVIGVVLSTVNSEANMSEKENQRFPEERGEGIL